MEKGGRAVRICQLRATRIPCLDVPHAPNAAAKNRADYGRVDHGKKETLSILHDYASGSVGTRATIERLGMDDYADLIIALSQNHIDLPKPTETPILHHHLERARAVLLPRLKHGD